MTQNSPRRTSALPVYFALLLLGIFTVIFVLEFFINDPEDSAASDAGLTADTYMVEVNRLLVDADPANGNILIEQYECAVCHRVGADRVAPSFAGIALRAASRRPPLTAAAYIYESITHPSAYVVEDYADAMVKNYPERLTDRELGDIIAYLLSGGAQ